ITFQAFTDTGTHPGMPGGDPVFFGNATAGNLPGGDFDGFPPTNFTILAGQTGVDISVHTRPDFVNEGDEIMSLRLQNVNGATISPGIGTSRGVGTIIDDPVTKISYYADPVNPSNPHSPPGFNQVVEGNDFAYHFHRDVTTN